VCCSVCCSVCYSLGYSALQCVAVRCSALQCVAVRCNILQCVAVCRNASQYVAACCSMSPNISSPYHLRATVKHHCLSSMEEHILFLRHRTQALSSITEHIHFPRQKNTFSLLHKKAYSLSSTKEHVLNTFYFLRFCISQLLFPPLSLPPPWCTWVGRSRHTVKEERQRHI